MNETTAATRGLVPVPPAHDAAIRAWARPLVDAAGPALKAVYLYGSALTASFDPPASDVNLLFVVSELPFDRLAALARALPASPKKPETALRFTPLVLTEAQIRASIDVFPLEFFDLTERRALVDGTDVLADVAVGRANLRHQCEYELRSKLVGLRQAFLLGRGEQGLAHRLLLQAAGGSAALFRHLLTLLEKPHPDGHEPVVAAVAVAYRADAAALAAPFVARRTPRMDDAAARGRFAAHLAALEGLIAAVDALPGV